MFLNFPRYITDYSTDVPILREAFPDWKIGNGIFDALAEQGEMPWAEDADSNVLDFEYFGNHSGGKFVSPIIMNLLGDNEELLDTDRALLAKIIWMKFKEPWSHLWETNVAAYNPIHNYNMSETRHLERDDVEDETERNTSVDSTTHGKRIDDTITHGKTTSDTVTHGKTVSDVTTHGKTVSDTITHGKDTTEETTHGKTVDIVDGVWGMNSGQMSKPSDKSVTTEGGTTVVDTQEGGTTQESTTEGGTTSNAVTEGGTTRESQSEGGTTADVTQESGTTARNVSDSSTRDFDAGRVEDETITRSGNIGVTTTQQMLTSERELWLWNFFDQVYKDIDTVLALPIYDTCRI